METTSITKTEINLLKNDLRKSIKREFAKAQKNNVGFTNKELLEIYTEALGKLLEVIPNNVNGETFLTNILLSE